MKKILILPALLATFKINAVNPEVHDAFMENPWTPESHKFVTKMYYAAVSAERSEERTKKREDIRMNPTYQAAEYKQMTAWYAKESTFLKSDFPDRDPQVLGQNHSSARAEAEQIADDLEDVRLPNLGNMRRSALIKAKEALQTISNTYDTLRWNKVQFEDDKARLAMHRQLAKQYQAIFSIPGLPVDAKAALGLMYDRYEARADDEYKTYYSACIEGQLNK